MLKTFAMDKFWRVFLCGALALSLLATPAFAAGDDDDDDDDDAKKPTEQVEEKVPTYEEEKAQIDEVIKNRIAEYRTMAQQAFAGERTVQEIQTMIRMRMNLPLPLGDFRILRRPGLELDWKNNPEAPPKKDKNRIAADVRKAAEKHALEKLRPEERKSVLPQAAERKYPLAKIGERISLMLRNGRGADTIIENQPYNGCNEEIVILGRRRIIRSDLSDADQARFYVDLNEKLRKEYIANETAKIDSEVATMISEECIENTAPEFRNNGWVPDIRPRGGKPTTASLTTSKPEFWMPKRNFIAMVRAYLVRRFMDDRVAKDLPKYLSEKGYKFVPTKDEKPLPIKEGDYTYTPMANGKGMEWITEREKQARENPQPAGDPNAPPM